jgi:hypothetical protein
VTVIFVGYILSGFADGTFVQVAPAEDNFTKKVGADGEVARAQGRNATSEVTITLLATSDSNDILNTIKESDRLISDGVLPLSIIDDSTGRTDYYWPEAWIKKTPEGEFGKEVGDRAWVFDTGQPDNEYV